MRIAVIGATGYSGTEALRLLAPRTDLEVVWVGSHTHAGKTVKTVLPQLQNTTLSELIFADYTNPTAFPEGTEVVLLALPHGEALRIAPQLLEQDLRVIDFSGDFRLDKTMYEKWYGRPWDTLYSGQVVYGLPELNKKWIKDASLIANPGCYATTAALALIPLLEAGLIESSRIMIDAKSGVSGAGKAPTTGTHFVEVQESLRAYKVGAHQHTPEIEQTLHEARRRWQGEEQHARDSERPTVLMTTQLLPIRRGIYVTAYALLHEDIEQEELYTLYTKRYEQEPFVQVLPSGQVPEIRYVVGTNLCQIGLHVDHRTRTVLVMAALDNLIKGAAGQAIQNLNIMGDFGEATGLPIDPWF